MNTAEEFIKKYPVGTLISYIEGVQYVRSGARTIFKISRYERRTNDPWGYYMYGTYCGFNFQTVRYKKEYSTSDLPKWRCIICETDPFGISLGILSHKFNDVRLANDLETSIFNDCMTNGRVLTVNNNIKP